MKDKSNNMLSDFKQYYQTYASSLTMFARRFVATEIAEDIIQDLFLDIWDNPQFRENPPSHSYLFTAVRNRCFNIITREQVKRNYVDTTKLDNRILGLDYYESHEKLLIGKEEIQYVYNEIERLPEKCRQTFKMSYIDEKRNAEIANELNISIRTVEHHLYLGLKTLRDRLTSKGKKHLFLSFFL